MPKRLKREPGWFRHSAAARRHLDPLPDDVGGSGGVWAVGMVRDEADIIETVVRHLLAQGVARVVIADNLSTDGTHEILERLARSHPVTVLMDRLPDYYQGEKTTLLARAAAKAGASWVIPFDADEIWQAPTGSLTDWLAACDGDVVQARMFNHVPTLGDDLSEPDPVRRLRWRKTQPNRLHKVAFRAHRRARLAYGNHGVARRGRRASGLEIRHFPYRSEEQFVRKLRQGSAALNATDLTAEIGKAWRGLGALDEDGMRGAWRTLVETQNLPFEWWVPGKGLVEDPVSLDDLSPGR
ncbi:MAG TPA: glycosyltransferase family 2 protein [Acidimicrobiales bacterium]|nr:glycosyltransferase family 2 protein [Acidimicrobiales bacterium]